MHEDLHLGTKRSGWIRPLDSSRTRHQPHTHDELECNLIRRGTASYLVDNTRVDMAAGDCIWLHPGHEHLLLHPSSNLEAWVLVLSPRALKTLANGVPNGEQLVNPAPQVCHIVRRLDTRSLHACNTLLADIYQAAGLDRRWMNSAMPWVFARLWLAFGQAEQRPQRTLHPAIHAARKLIHQNPESWTRDRLANACGLSPAHFSRIFAEQLGMSLTDYRNHLRLTQAIELLRSSDLDVLSVAMRVGFGSYPQFHRVFTANIGKTPAAWRRSIRKETAHPAPRG